MRKLAALMTCLASPALAQSTTDMTDAMCAALNAKATPLLENTGVSISTAFVAQDGWCVTSDITTPPDGYVSYGVRSIAVRMDDPDRLIDGDVPPTAVSLKVVGFHVIPTSIDDPVFDYLLRAQSAPGGIDFGFEAIWDEATNALTINDLSMVYSDDNFARMTAAINGLDLTDMSSIEVSVLGAVVNDMTLDIATNGLFENFALMPIGTALLGNADDPEAEVARLKGLFADMIGTVPAEIMDAASTQALIDMVNEMPNPAGTLALHVQSDVGIGAVRLTPTVLTGVPTAVEDVWAILDGVSIDANWTPTTP